MSDSEGSSAGSDRSRHDSDNEGGAQSGSDDSGSDVAPSRKRTFSDDSEEASADEIQQRKKPTKKKKRKKKGGVSVRDFLDQDVAVESYDEGESDDYVDDLILNKESDEAARLELEIQEHFFIILAL